MLYHARRLLPTARTIILRRPFLAGLLLLVGRFDHVRRDFGRGRRLLLFSFLNAKLGSCQLLLEVLHLRQGSLELLF